MSYTYYLGFRTPVTVDNPDPQPQFLRCSDRDEVLEMAKSVFASEVTPDACTFSFLTVPEKGSWISEEISHDRLR